MDNQTGEQAPAASLEDRIAEQFLGSEPPPKKQAPPPQDDAPDQPESEDATSEEEPPPAAEVEEIEYEGERYQVPPKLKDAFLRNADYTKKTQALAEQQRALELTQEQQKIAALEQNFYESVKQDSVQLTAIEQYLEQAKQTDWSSMTAEEMFRRKIEIDGIKERRDALREAIDNQRKAYQDKTKQMTDELRSKALDSVRKTVPNFSEEFIKKSAKSEGFTDAEIDGVLLDPRSAKVLWKAAQYDQLQSAKTEAVKKASTAPPMLKPGSANPMSQDVKSDLAMRKQQAKATTSAEKARIIQRRLEQRF